MQLVRPVQQVPRARCLGLLLNHTTTVTTIPLVMQSLFKVDSITELVTQVTRATHHSREQSMLRGRQLPTEVQPGQQEQMVQLALLVQQVQLVQTQQL